MKKNSTEYELHRDEPIASGIRRIALEELDYAIGQLRGSLGDEDRHERVHEARKTIKRLRGLIRLVRQELTPQFYARENACFRQAAQRLAAAREAAAAGEAFESLVSRFQAERVPADFDRTRRKLDELQSRAFETSLAPEIIAEVTQHLGEVQGRVADWPLVLDGWEAVSSGLCRIYGQGRHEYALALEAPTVENLHEWRKRVKYHWFHVRLLRRSWGTVMAARRDALKGLSDLLGDDHDLTELRLLLLCESGDPPMIDSELARLLALIDRRREELVAAAYVEGARLYAESPRQLGGRLGAYFRAWHSEPRISPSTHGA